MIVGKIIQGRQAERKPDVKTNSKKPEREEKFQTSLRREVDRSCTDRASPKATGSASEQPPQASPSPSPTPSPPPAPACDSRPGPGGITATVTSAGISTTTAAAVGVIGSVGSPLTLAARLQAEIAAVKQKVVKFSEKLSPTRQNVQDLETVVTTIEEAERYLEAWARLEKRLDRAVEIPDMLLEKLNIDGLFAMPDRLLEKLDAAAQREWERLKTSFAAILPTRPKQPSAASNGAGVARPINSNGAQKPQSIQVPASDGNGLSHNGSVKLPHEAPKTYSPNEQISENNVQRYADLLLQLENVFDDPTDYLPWQGAPADRRRTAYYNAADDQRRKIQMLLNVVLNGAAYLPEHIVEMARKALAYRRSIFIEMGQNVKVLGQKSRGDKIEQVIIGEMKACLRKYLAANELVLIKSGSSAGTIMSKAERAARPWGQRGVIY